MGHIGRIGSIYDMHSDGVVSDPIAVDIRSLAVIDDNLIGRSSDAAVTHTKVTESLCITFDHLYSASNRAEDVALAICRMHAYLFVHGTFLRSRG
jgi:hypothetical protein